MLDIFIAGGGPVGAALALGLKATDFGVALADSTVSATGTDRTRTIALSQGSRLILERLGVWDAVEKQATRIGRIEVSQQSGYGRVSLAAEQARVPALGYVVTHSVLRETLAGALKTQNVSVFGEPIVESPAAANESITVALARSGDKYTTRLLAIADGGNAKEVHGKARDYGQSAVVCNVATEAAHENRAFERFTPDGPLALLPHGQNWSLVWTTSARRAHDLAAADDATFCRALENAFGNSLGFFSVVSPRAVFALALRVASSAARPRTVLIGNAAQTLHPVAGQGFNLGLRDAWELTRTISTRYREDPGSAAALNTYLSQRRFDRNATVLFTDSLIRLFCKDIPLLRGVRGAGLATLDAISPAKNFLVRRMMFGARG